MLLKKAKNNHRYIWLALACLALLCFFAPQPAHAYNFTSPTLLGDQICPGTGFTRRIVPCIKENFLTATNNFLIPFSKYLADAVTASCILAVMMWGAKMLSGSDVAPLKDSMVTALKIGFVVLFTYDFGGYSLDPTDSSHPNGHHGGNFGLVLDVMDDMLTYVSGYVIQASDFGLNGVCQQFAENNKSYLVWDAIDCAIESLIGGIFSPFTISAGIIGFLTACIFSNAIGFTIGIVGFYLIYKIIMAVIRCVYIFLSAYMGVSFMVVISPLFIPTILFKPTKPYFDRWLKLFTSFMLQPMMVFAYLAMLMAAFDTVVFSGENSLCNTLTKNACAGGSIQIGAWMEGNGFYTTVEKDADAITINNKAIQEAGLIPKTATTGGAEGKVADATINYIESKQLGLMEMLGVGGSNPSFLQMSIPEQTVSWTKLAIASGFDGSSGSKSTLSYMLEVLVSAFMALLTAYIFVDMLEAIPLIGSGMANYGKPGDSVSAELAIRREKGGGGGSGIAGNFGLGL